MQDDKPVKKPRYIWTMMIKHPDNDDHITYVGTALSINSAVGKLRKRIYSDFRVELRRDNRGSTDVEILSVVRGPEVKF